MIGFYNHIFRIALLGDEKSKGMVLVEKMVCTGSKVEQYQTNDKLVRAKGPPALQYLKYGAVLCMAIGQATTRGKSTALSEVWSLIC